MAKITITDTPSG